MTTPENYTRPAVAVHWLIAILVLVALPLGYYMTDLSLSPRKLQLISWHKWIGFTVLLLFIPRVIVRLTRRVPAPVTTMPGWQRTIASITHVALYALMVAVPATGWLMSSAKGFPVVYLGLVPLPDLVGKDEALGNLLKSTHEVLTSGLLILVGLHIAAALKHHIIDRDETLARMVPLLKR
ncbi:cytochrome b [Aromatoleum toluvorans]|uniref:Cytochrome b n=1 Tax=Aromatoleum toluvorans TaxID=92002 RepID=A0ABX1Q207_9RHOO|nr:cytochrome b [Aromatoleum toluvorans]NMG44391.1 cytochrome b [Aromatoleum toluvorans]